MIGPLSPIDPLALAPPWLLAQGAGLLPVVPLLVGAALAVLPSRDTGRSLAWFAAVLTTGALSLVALLVCWQVWTGGPFVYAMGGWEPPRGITLDLNAATAPVALLILLMAVATLAFARRAVVAEIEPKKRAATYGAFLIVLAGLVGIALTGDAFNAFVFIEISSIPTYVLVAMGAARDRRALASAFNYLILGSIGATFFVIGIGFLFAETGTLNMNEMRELLARADGGSRVAQVGFAFIVIGLGLKLAMWPLHTWLPGAYAFAPTFVTAFLASTATKAAFLILVRFVFTVFDIGMDYVAALVAYGITSLAVAAMCVGSFQAIFQTDARRALAYSSVAQIGYMLLGVGIATAAGLAAGWLHLVNHAVVKGGLFIALGTFWYRFGITRVSDFAGLGKLMPWTMWGFTVCALGLIGVPFTAGFISKLALATAAAERGWWWALAVIVFSSVLAIVYLGRILLVAFFQPPPANAHRDGVLLRMEGTPLMAIALWSLATANILIGTFPEGLSAAADAAGLALAGGG